MALPKRKQTQTAIAYYRVSTKQQGASGLGLDAQTSAVAAYCKAAGLDLVAAYTEIETGTSKKVRPVVRQALEHARRIGGTLVIAKLDRLARNVSFISALMDAGVAFVACDMPDANTLTLHIMAALAEYEAKLISERTKAALHAAKARGQKLGSPQNLTDEIRAQAVAANIANAVNDYKPLTSYISTLHNSGMSLRDIATRLNDDGHTTRTGAQFGAMQIKRILDRAHAK